VLLSILTPAFNEATNLEALYARVVATAAQLGIEWEWLIVDDHSRDDTFGVIQRLAAADPRVRGVRLARNSGSHVAITCGLHLVRGDAAVMMAADLQDPPETLGMMVEGWKAGTHVVWAVRRQRPGGASHAGFAAIYYWVMRNVVGMKDMPANGADFFLADRAVIDAFRKFPERSVSVLALVMWLGFRQEFIEYDKQPRTSGKSGWTLSRKVKLVVDSVTAFSEAPIRACTLLGLGLLVVALVLAVAGFARWLQKDAGHLMLLVAAVAGVGGLQLVATGMVGEYVWRALEESRRRPQFVIEKATAEPARSGELS
jgi:glycosyltransferase involved in cell wall biosynthesis